MKVKWQVECGSAEDRDELVDILKRNGYDASACETEPGETVFSAEVRIIGEGTVTLRDRAQEETDGAEG